MRRIAVLVAVLTAAIQIPAPAAAPLFPRTHPQQEKFSQQQQQPRQKRNGRLGSQQGQCDPWVSNHGSSGSSTNGGNSVARRCAADILSLVGSIEDRGSIEESRSAQLLSCIRFLVPPLGVSSTFSSHLLEQTSCSSSSIDDGGADVGEQQKITAAAWRLVRQPPQGVLELAQRAVEWAGEPDALLTELSSSLYEVPDVEGSHAAKCSLTKHDCAKRFASQEINTYLAFLFETIAALAPSAGFNVSLNRYDLFHGHMFTAYGTGRLGILFHCREYPAFDKSRFPVNLGYCQAGSSTRYDESMNLRNVIWLAPLPSCSSHVCTPDEWLASGTLFILDADPDGLVFQELVSEWVDIVRTVYESDFGRTVIDVNYFRTPSNTSATNADRIFLS